MASGKKQIWDNIKLPSAYCSTTNDKWASYRLGEEAGEYKGWSLSHPSALVRSENIKAANGVVEVSADTLIFRPDSYSFMLRKGKITRKMTVEEGKERFGGILDTFIEKTVLGVLNAAEDQLALDSVANDAEFAREEAARMEAKAFEPTADEYAEHLAQEQRGLLSNEDIKELKINDFSLSVGWDGKLSDNTDYVFCENENATGCCIAHFLNSDITVKSSTAISGSEKVIKFVHDAIVALKKDTYEDGLADAFKNYLVVDANDFAELTERVGDIEALSGEFEEDLFSTSEGQVVKSVLNDKYTLDNLNGAGLCVNEKGELVFDSVTVETLAQQIKGGEKVFYNDLHEATVALVGGKSKTFEDLPEEEQQSVLERYSELFRVGETDYSYIPTKEEFVKSYLIEKGQAKFINYKNEKHYENNIPYVLRNSKNYVNWRFQFTDNEGNALVKPWKIPINPRTGGRAMPNTSSTWGTFDEACKGADRGDNKGIGIVFDNRGLVCIDLDGCIDANGNISQFASDVVKKLNSYTEISPSGTGLHILAFGKIPENINNQSAGIEMYIKDHYVIMTGNRLQGTSLSMAKSIDTQPVLEELYNAYKSQLKVGMTKVINAVGAPTRQTATSKEIVDRMKKSKNFDKYLKCAQGKPPFVWDVNTSSFTDEIDKYFVKESGEPDKSALDLAFCKGLVFFRATPAQIDEIYRAQSSTNKVEGLTLEDADLARPKWDKLISTGGITYGQYVINGAYAGMSTTWGANGKYNRMNKAKAAKKSNFNEGGE